MIWKILLFETPEGQPVVEKFLNGLQTATKQKVARHFDLLEHYGPDLGMPHSKPLGDGLYELRVRGRQEVRILYVFAIGHTIFLLHGFLKKTQIIPKRELDLARHRQQMVNNNYDV